MLLHVRDIEKAFIFTLLHCSLPDNKRALANYEKIRHNYVQIMLEYRYIQIILDYYIRILCYR